MTHVSPHHRRTSNRRRRLVTRTGAALVAAAIGLAVTTVTGAGPAPNETVTRTMSGTGTVTPTPTLRFAGPRGTIVEPRLVERTAIRDVTGDGVPDWLAADDGAGEGDGAVGVRRTWLIDGASGRLRMACRTDALPVVPPDRARGDLDGDGVVDHRDVARAIERLAREPPPADAARALLDALSNLGRAPIADAIDDLDPPECDPDGACPCIPVQDPDGGWTCLCCLNCAGCEDRRPPGSSRPVGPPSGITPPPGAGGPGGPGGPDHGGGTGDDGADGPPPPRPGPAPPADTQPCLIVISDWSPDPDDACITVGDTVCYHVVAAAGGPTCPVLWTIDGPAAGSATPDGRTICITALGLGDIVVGATQDDCGCGGAAFVDVLPVRLGVDLDIDSDNSGDFALPDRSQAEDAVEDIEGDDAHPGKVILVNTLDADRDSIPDHLDGFGFPGAIEDALTSTGSRLHPVVIDLRGWPLDGEVELDILYDGPDRAAPILLAGPPYTMVDAPLRLWRADGAAARDPASIADGGDFIPPGRARAVDLGLSAAAPTTTIFVEALEPSVLVADRTIEVVAFIDGVEQCHDRVRLTAIRIELLGAAAPSGPYAPVAMLVASVPVDERAWSIPPPGTSWGIEPCFRVRIADPRGAPAGPVQLGAATLSLHAAPGGYETAPFCCLAAADAGAAGDLPLPVVLLDASDVVVSYNPATFLSVWAPKRPSEAKLGLGGLLIAVIRFLEESGWTPLDDADAGAFGKVVHEEVSSQLAGEAGWATNVVVDLESRRVLSINGGTGGPGSIEVDVIRLKGDYVPRVGQRLRIKDIEFVAEIKTSAGGRISGAQIARYRTLLGSSYRAKFNILLAPRRYTAQRGWHATPGVSTLWKVLGAVGIGTALTSWVLQPPDIDNQLSRLVTALARANRHRRDEVQFHAEVVAVGDELRILLDMIGLSNWSSQISYTFIMTVIGDSSGSPGTM